MPHWRRMTWALVCLALIAAAGLLSNATALTESAAFATWPFLILWFLSRPRNNTVVFGPQGQQVMLSEQEAKRRVENLQGWSYRSEGGG